MSSNGNGNHIPGSMASLAPAKPKRKWTRRPREGGPITIEKGIPLPPPTHVSKYPWSQMQPGDSFFVPNGPKSLFGTCSKRTKDGPHKYTARYVQVRGVKGVRVWRTE